MVEKFSVAKDKILASILGIISLGAISWAGWTTAQVSNLQDRPTLDQVKHLIEQTAPYAQDRNWIKSELEHGRKATERLTGVIEANTDAINALKVSIARLNPNRNK